MSHTDNTPIVEVSNAFDEDDFIGPPPSFSAQTDKPPQSNDRPITRARLSGGYARQKPMPPTFVGMDPPSPASARHTEPVTYTPRTPSEINTQQATPRRATRRPRSEALSSNSVPQPPSQRPAPVQPEQPRIAPPPNSWSSITNAARLGSAPNFTTFGNGTPQSQTSIDWRSHYLNRPRLPLNNPRLPILAHVQTPMTNNVHQTNVHPAHTSAQSNSASLMQAHSSNGPSRQQRFPNMYHISQRGPVPRNFTPQAVPVRTAYDDIMRQMQTAAGLNFDTLLSQIVSNPNQPVQISVPNGIDSATMQRNIHQQLESALLTQVPGPIHDPGNLELIDDLIKYFHSQNSQPVPNMPPVPNVPHVPPVPPAPKVLPSEDDMARQDVDADAFDEENRNVDTYADYVPAKLEIGIPHPDPVVETSSLSTVEPPNINYQLKLPPNIIADGLLSALQLESIIYACQQHNKFLADNHTRRGFLIGDGAGVGKGRTIAGLIYENFLRGREKSIWLSVSTDLKLDAERDLRDIGAKIPVHLLGKFQYGRRIDASHGIMFLTYAGLVSKSQSIRGSLGNRLDQLVAWVTTSFEGAIVFDECHKAKNISMTKNKKNQTKAAEFALKLQARLPRARVIYASATGASETKHLGYMTRLGIWGKGTPYHDFANFCNAIEKRGVGAMELVAVDLKMRGAYIARQLSFKTTSFEIRVANLDDDFIRLYDDCVEMWAKALELFSQAANYLEDRKSTRTIWTTFWGAHQKFFKYLCIGAKVPLVIRIAKEALLNDRCVVIGLQSTGEAKTNEALEDGDINEFVSTAKATFESLVRNHFPAPFESRRIRQQASRSTASNSGSSSSTIDESYQIKDSVKFVMQDGVVVKAQLENDKLLNSRAKRSSKMAAAKQLSKKEIALAELAAEKRRQSTAKSSRAIRAKQRSLKRNKAKSRIKKGDDSDTELSNPLSDSSSASRLPSTSTSDRNDSDVTYSEDSSGDESSSTVVGSDVSDLSVVVESKRRKQSSKTLVTNKRSVLNSDSDSDIEIVKTVRPKPKPTIIFLSDDEDDETAHDDPILRHGPMLTKMRDELYRLIDDLAPRLPKNTLDDLIDQLGGPSKVAEMTGRKGRIVKDDDGSISYKTRNIEDALENLNIAEKERFMRGQKLIAIISEAASSGISLQSDKRCANTKRRVHITIELPWSADRAIQQFGRTHRSNQANGPEYVFIISELAGEKRFASIVAKRLESLGALTHGDRRATSESRDLSQYNILSKYSKHALDELFRYLESGRSFANIRPNFHDERDFINLAKQAFVGAGLARSGSSVFIIEPNASQVNHFLNRLLGMKVVIQNALFELFTEYLNRLIARKKVSGQYDSGILELNSESGKTRCSEPHNFNLRTEAEVVKCTLREVQVERGISFEEALSLLEEAQKAREDSRSGFYLHTNPLSKARMVFLFLREPESIDLFRNYKPNTGRQAKAEHYSIGAEKGKQCSPKEAEKLWRHMYEVTDKNCVHICLFHNCKRREAKMKCDVGLRHRKYCILSGGILTAWPYLERMAADVTIRLEIVRLRLDENNRVIGPIIPQDSVERVKKLLKKGEEEGVAF